MGKTAARNNNIDTVKFLLIFSIYIFHFFKAAGGLYTFANTYQVQAFFMVSGFWALNHKERSIWEFVKNAFKRYLLPWFIWVCIYTVYFSVSKGYGARATAEIFFKYIKAVRGSGISGMWFVPAFFFVALSYHIISKLTSGLKFKGVWGQPLVNLLITFAVYYVFRYINPKVMWIFTLDWVPEYLFYFSLGTVCYKAYLQFSAATEEKINLRRLVYGLSAVVSVAYMAGVYFKKTDLLWKWTKLFPADIFSFLPSCVAIIMSLIAFCSIAELISCKTTEKIGRSTLILCCSEVFVKDMIISVFGLLGLTVKAENPVECVIFAFVALVAATYTVVPFTEKIISKIFKKSLSLPKCS